MQAAKTKKVLVIDDEDIVRISCERSLSGQYDVNTAASGQQGLDLFSKGHYDLVLVDLKMPAMNGIEVLMNIKRQKPEQKVIVMTGYDTEEHIEQSMSSGAALYMEKPFTPDALMNRVKEALER
jgi:DNA-binding NtrC family response regulator